MKDHLEGLIDGVGMALCLAEKNRRNPKRIESLLVSLIRDLATVSGNEQLDRVHFNAGYARRHPVPHPKQ